MVSASGRPRSVPLSIEGLWNAVGQQRGGLLWELLRIVPGRDRGHPVVDAISGGAFNTNPVLAGYVTGALAVELAREARERDPQASAETVTRFRTTLAPLLAMAGDRLFWGGLRPALSLLGLLCALLKLGEPAVWYWLGYNGIQFYWRRRAWRVGTTGEAGVRREIRERGLERWAAGLAGAGRVLLGATLGVAATGLWATQGAGTGVLWVLVCVLGFGVAAAGRFAPLAVGWIGVAAACAVAGGRFVMGRWAR